MIRVVLILLLTGCVRPAPASYCPYTCSTIRAAWEDEIADPNDATRLRWCVCRVDGQLLVGLPPRRPTR